MNQMNLMSFKKNNSYHLNKLNVIQRQKLFYKSTELNLSLLDLQLPKRKLYLQKIENVRKLGVY